MGVMKMTITKYNYNESDTKKCMENILTRLEMTIDTVLDLQGFKHSSKDGWLGDAGDFNDWIECVIEFLEDIKKPIQTDLEIECNIEQFYNLVNFAKEDILKDICNVY